MITYKEYIALAFDPETTEEKLMEFSKVVKGDSLFDFTIAPDETKVMMSDEEQELENAMAIGNNFCRWSRKRAFNKRIKNGDKRPILVAEGDSWFQFPFIIKETVDNLKDDYTIYSLGAAGDTAENMIFSESIKKKTEYLLALREMKARNLDIRAFLFSGAGNDIIGENAEGESSLQGIIKDFNGDKNDVVGHINFAKLHERLSRLRLGYLKVISSIRAERGFESLPILIHGYDYVFPYPWENDHRNPSYAKKNEWLGEPLDYRKIVDRNLRRNILKFLIDQLYEMMADIAQDSVESKVYVVDCRGAMPDLGDWNDEIHGTSDGFSKVKARFVKTLKEVQNVTEAVS